MLALRLHPVSFPIAPTSFPPTPCTQLEEARLSRLGLLKK